MKRRLKPGWHTLQRVRVYCDRDGWAHGLIVQINSHKWQWFANTEPYSNSGLSQSLRCAREIVTRRLRSLMP